MSIKEIIKKVCQTKQSKNNSQKRILSISMVNNRLMKSTRCCKRKNTKNKLKSKVIQFAKQGMQKTTSQISTLLMKSTTIQKNWKTFRK